MVREQARAGKRQIERSLGERSPEPILRAPRPQTARSANQRHGRDPSPGLLWWDLDSIADTGDAIGKGIKTGLTFGGVGSRVTDSYVLTATFKPTGGPAVQKIYRHALHSAIGASALGS
jgi:hypothetical protein